MDKVLIVYNNSFEFAKVLWVITKNVIGYKMKMVYIRFFACWQGSCKVTS